MFYENCNFGVHALKSLQNTHQEYEFLLNNHHTYGMILKCMTIMLK